MTLVLGIESSCDETAAAVVRDGRTVLSNVVASQIELHRAFRGVVPEIASRSHTRRILPVIEAALEEAGVEAGQLDAIAVTHRPGMIGCLLVGLAAAKAMSWLYDVPLIGIDHLRAHIDAAFLVDPELPLPGCALVASGGHTALYVTRDRDDVECIGRTRDDAAGEALDKGAALLGLPYPGGPAIEARARSGDPRSLDLPRPMLHEPSFDFSFSGIKTALLYHLRGSGLTRPLPDLSPAQVDDLAAAYQTAVVDVLVAKLRRAAQACGARTLSIGGGVARNGLLRARIADDPVLGALHLAFPPADLCSDNGAMIAGLGAHLLAHGRIDDLDLQAAATARSRR